MSRSGCHDTGRVPSLNHGVPQAPTVEPSGLIDPTVERRHFTATVGSLVTYRALVSNLVFKDLKLKYRGSALGFLWSLVNPLALTAVYTFAFKYVMGVRQPGFAYFLLVGVTAWAFFAGATQMSTTAIIDGGPLMTSVRFPRAILPLATVLFNLAQYLLTLGALLPVLFLAYRMPPALPLLSFPVILVCQALFTAGVALFLAGAAAHFRDVRHFVEIGLMLLFWLTPVVYPLSQVPSWVRAWVVLSPMAPFIESYHQIFIEGAVPSALLWALCVGYGVTVGAAGLLWFSAIEDDLSEHL